MKKIALAALLAGMASGSVVQAATIVQNGSFEDAPASGTKGVNNRLFSTLTTSAPGWEIFTSLPGWTTVTGAGIEVQTDAAVPDTNALFGKHYVELDSKNNASMSQTLTNLGAGSYLLSFWYSPRTNTAATNGIGYSIADLVGSVTGPGGPLSTTVGNWTEITGKFFVKTAGDYNLDFRAEGTSDSFGGFVDNVSVTVAAVPVPAAGLLLVGAIGGLAALHRRRKAV